MIEFSMLSVALFALSYGWTANLDKDGSISDLIVAGLALIAAVAGVFCLVLALWSAPWGAVL